MCAASPEEGPFAPYEVARDHTKLHDKGLKRGHTVERAFSVDVDRKQLLNVAVGERVRERRLSKGDTLKNIATSTGLSVSLISQIELGKSAASVYTLHKLSHALGVKMTYFFESI
jgi:ribosome-binding protein aMBF1 (putative translation factor)